MDTIAPEPLEGEALAVFVWRFEQARQAGLLRVEAERFASSGVDVGVLRRLVKDGCPPRTLAEIVT